MGEATPAGTPVGRRVVLGMAVAGAAGVLWGSGAQSAVGRLLAPVTSAGGTGLSGLLPGANRFRIYSVVDYLPHRDPSRYRLELGGLVDRPATLTVDDLRAMPATRLVRTFQCVTGWRVPGVEWKGVRLGRLLDEAGIRSEARGVEFRSFDGVYTESLSLAQARRADILVAYEMQGQPVSDDHGGPVRLYAAPMFGYKSCKWLSSIRAVTDVVPGYWEQRGYPLDAWLAGATNLPTPS